MEILNRIARNDHDQLVYAEDAIRKGNYTCPNCKEQLIFRRSDDLTKKGAKRPHFAHASGTSACTPETILHEAFKKLIHDRLKEAIAEDKAVPIKWTCTHCEQEHERNLVSTAIEVKMEHDMKTARADVSLINKKNETVAAIEVVVTHTPEPEVVEFYKKQNTVLILFDVHTAEDLSRASAPILEPDHVDYCMEGKRCSECGEYKKDMIMRIMDMACGNCGVISKAAYIHAGANRLSIPAEPEYFTPDEIEQAKAEGASIRYVPNQILEKKAYANACSGCRRPFNGPWHPLARGQKASEMQAGPKEIQIGMYCEPCTERSSRKEINKLLGRLRNRIGQVKEPMINGHCIRCKGHVEPRHVYCTKCFDSWSRYSNQNYRERYCFECGDPWPTSRADIRCTNCKRKWGQRQSKRDPLEKVRDRLIELKKIVNHIPMDY